MASRNLKPSAVQGFDSANINDKMQSSTLKRQPSPDWSKADLLRLLSYFEGELQARDITIATLKAEKAKQLLYQAKYGRFGLGDPFVALQRDAEGKNDTGFDEAAIKSMYDNQLAQLENLIATQRKAQLKMREQLGNSEKRFHKVCTELEEEKQKHAQDTAQGDDVTYMLEKERERLKAEIDFEKSQNKKLEKDLKKTLSSLEEERANAARHKQVAIMLIKERKNLIERIVAENQLRDEMESALTDGKSKIQNMAEGLAQESKKSLKMEAALDKQSSKFDSERESLRHRLQEEEKQTNILRAEVSRLSKQVEQLQVQLRSSTTSPSGMQARSTVSPARATNSASGRNTGIPGVVTASSGSSPQSPLVDSPPLEHLSTTANVVSHPESSHSLEFLGPEMANLQKLLATMTRGETSEGNSHVTMSSAPEASSSSPLLLSSASPHTPISQRNSSSPPPPNMNKITPSQHVKDLQEQNNNTLKLVLDKQEMNVSTTVTAQLGTPISIPLHIYDERTTNTPNTYMSHNILSPTAVSPSFSTMTSSPKINQPAGSIMQSQNVLINPLSLPTTVTSPSLRRKSIPSRSRSKSPTKALLHHSRSSSLHKVSAAHESSIPGSLGSSVFQLLTSPSPSDDRLPDVHQKSALGDVIALHQILTASPTAVNLAIKDGTTPLHTAVENEQEASLKVLLSYGASPNCSRDGNLTPLHIAAMKGYPGCLGLLLSVGAKVNLASATDQTPLHLAVKAGQLDCCQILLRYDADVLSTGQDGLTSIHYAVQHNHPDILKLLLDKLGLLNSPRDSDVGYQIVGITDKDGWTVAHMAAYLPKPDCLALLTENLPLDLDAKDKLGRSARATASASCRDTLAQLDQLVSPMMKVQVELRYILETKTVSNVQVGFMEISPGMGWRNLEHKLRATLDVYLVQLDAGLKTRRITRLEVDSDKGFTLGLTVANIKQFEMGFYKWTPGMQTDTAPYAMLTNNQFKRITIIVDDAGNMSELIAFDVLQPVSNINNYLRLLEQYKSVIFYGPAGSGKSYLAQRLAQSIAAQEMALGRKPGIYQLSLEPGYSWASFLTFLKQKSCVVPINRGHENIAPILVLDNLEAVDIAQMFGELLDAMEYRGIKHAFFLRGNDPVENGMHYLTDQFYLIGTMNKSRSLGVDLSILPRFRWVQFRLDTEPLRGLLARHFLRRIFNTYHGQLPLPEDPVLRSVEWIVCVWQRLNDSLNKLGLLDVVLGPCMFFKCPLEKQDHKLILEWMKTLWNQQIAPRVREAVKRGTGSESPTDGQQKVANTALYVLMQRSVMLGCPLVGLEKESYLKGFSGSNELSISLKPGDRSRVTSLTSPTSPRNSLLKHDPSSSPQSRRWRSDGDRSQTALVPSSAPEDKGRNGREERRPDNSLLASNIKRRSLSESSVNKAAQQEQEQRHIDNTQIPFSHHAKVAKLEVKSPKFVTIASAFRSPVLNHLQHQPDLEETPQPGPTVHKTGRVSPLLSLVTSSRNTGPNISPKKSRSSENITTSGIYGGSSKPKSPFSFSLSTPRSSLSSFKFLDNVSYEGADRTILTDQMPDFSVFDQVPTPTDERSQGFVFVKQADSKDTHSEKEDDVWSRRTHLLAPEQVGDNIRRENSRHKSVPS